MAPTTGWAPVPGEKYIAPLRKVAKRASPTACCSTEVGAPRSLSALPSRVQVS
ncbi:Uncharacterised protein [Mycobacteroides abscessus]|nr:Uncharacterised protein [Mycobacteroides abscessus]SHQ36347.1 Uncharacterised protein [Mycobacteroides abscessus subsp. abscessus]SHR11977.1 Uncharacterised protein [Mycobacteroides abscessus subsp. abscessus]SHS45634.1 Uncharacterised protein [Mycobacteroides abscessus subsp. abscessus]SHS99818.1 Uncharacterised protein [Mycobacteroides abscessus subsp. abscessus]